MTPEIKKNLCLLAPSVAFTITKEVDLDYDWGDGGPEAGSDVYDIIFTATAIIDGEFVKASTYLGGCHMKHDQEFGDCDGYLIQKLLEAIEALEGLLPNHFRIREQLNYASTWLRLEKVN